ncbi:lysis protein [Cronobacter sakazakii]|uniref:lysis protein n=1 Tax=Cronobacter TaxID=413496 RepID=UPI000B4B111C|nr:MULTISPECIES: lysis protein [Cronobacter]EKA9346357.1 lysis protein [Cronobacter sakazakii]ELL7784341.1 lysis protein [Cronobacter sakazakii]ELY2755089.1 lysis protein [Cronobacter sakazakii]ELY3569764.1 lysis protein [Cronobacter sakazakii]ELY3974846.1 lysis protein [Cronobacter sakazakii]
MAALWGFVRAGWKPLLFVVAVGMVLYYRASLIKTEASLTNVNRALKLAKDDIEDMQRRQRDVAALDAKYTKDLADAQKNIAQLELDVAAGRKRLQLNATCPANGAPGTTRVDDGAGPRLTDSAERDYFTLRSRIEIVTRQLTGLQEYVREQCLKQRISG